MIAAHFAVFGVAGVTGNWLATRLIVRLGLDGGVLAAMGLMSVGATLFGLAFAAALIALAAALSLVGGWLAKR